MQASQLDANGAQEKATRAKWQGWRSQEGRVRGACVTAHDGIKPGSLPSVNQALFGQVQPQTQVSDMWLKKSGLRPGMIRRTNWTDH